MHPTSVDSMSTFIKHTTSLCPVCCKLTPTATVFQNSGRVYMERTCEEHGINTFCISNDARLYHEAVGSGLNGCCGGSCGNTTPADPSATPGTLGANAVGSNDVVNLASCVTLIEITPSCNMRCPTCFADATFESAPSEDDMPFGEFVDKIEAIIRRKGELEILQLSGGEPTVHKDFVRILEWSEAHPKILCVLVNTNGLKIATDDRLIAEMARIEAVYDKTHIYLQFDGPQPDGQKLLRGGDFRVIRERALDRLREAKIPATLAMTVNKANLPFLWDAVQFGLGREEVHGLSFQPEFYSGRNSAGALPVMPDPISVADVITMLCEKSELLTFDDFTPTPCGHPMCQWIGWLGKMGDGTLLTASGMGIDLPALQAQIGNRIRFDAKDLLECQCETTTLGELIHEMEGLVQQTRAFRLFIKPFMDARAWDQDRIDRCCTHVVRPDGRLDSFCRYYASGGAQGNPANLKPKINMLTGS